MSCKLKPARWSHDTGQQIPYFDRCQLIITWMSDIKEVHVKPRLHVSFNLLLEYGRHVARLHRRRRRRRRRCHFRAYAPTSNTASHGTHEKINSWVPFSTRLAAFGRPSSAITNKQWQSLLSRLYERITSSSLQDDRWWVLSSSSLALLCNEFDKKYCCLHKGCIFFLLSKTRPSISPFMNIITAIKAAGKCFSHIISTRMCML